MVNKIKYIVLSLTCVLVMFLIGIMGYMSGEGEEEAFRVSVILEANSWDRWSVLRMGMEHAAKEFRVAVNFVTVNSESSVSECMDIIKREILNGADGMILDLPNISRLVKELDSLAPGLQMVMVESEIPLAGGYTYIAPDNYQMGYDLGTILQKKRKEGETVGLVAGSTRKTSNLDRKNGILAAVGEKTIQWSLEDEGDGIRPELEEMLRTHPVDYIVGLNSTVTEEIINVLEPGRTGCVFAIGNTEKIVYYVDKEVIDTLIAPNEYIMGYQSVKEMYHRLHFNNEGEGRDIDYLIIRKENLYDPQNQKLMFPMVQ